MHIFEGKCCSVHVCPEVDSLPFRLHSIEQPKPLNLGYRRLFGGPERLAEFPGELNSYKQFSYLYVYRVDLLN